MAPFRTVSLQADSESAERMADGPAGRQAGTTPRGRARPLYKRDRSAATTGDATTPGDAQLDRSRRSPPSSSGSVVRGQRLTLGGIGT